jgi:hypothetical protein
MSSRVTIGLTDVPAWALSLIKLNDGASPAEFRKWLKTCAQVLRGMCKVSHVFEHLEDPDIVEDLRRETEQMLAQVQRPNGAVKASTSKMSTQPDQSDQSAAALDGLMADLAQISAGLGDGEGEHETTTVPLPSGQEDTADIIDDASELGSNDNASRKSKFSISQGLKALQEDESFMYECLRKVITDATDVTRGFNLAKTSVLNCFLSGPDPRVGKSLTRSIKAKNMTHVFEAAIANADLAQFLRWLSTEINLKGKSDMVPELAYHKYSADYHEASTWNRDKASLAQYLENVSVAKDIFATQCAELGLRKSDSIINATSIGILLMNVCKDTSLYDFYAPYLHERKTIPFGGYESMRRDLVMFIEHRGKSAEYGFNLPTKAKDKDPFLGTGKPAVSTAQASTDHAPATKIRGNKDTVGFLLVCKYCLGMGHKLEECRKHEKDGKPSITPEQKEAFKIKIKELRASRGATNATDSSSGEKAASGQPKTSNAANASNTSDEDERRVYFVRYANMVHVSCQEIQLA